MGSVNRTGVQQLMSVSRCSLLEIAEERLSVCCVESVGVTDMVLAIKRLLLSVALAARS